MLARGSINKHIISETHKKSVLQHNERDSRRTQAEAALQARDLRVSSLAGRHQLLPPNTSSTAQTESVATSTEHVHPSFDGVLFDRSCLIGPDDNPILLTAGRTRDQRDRGRIMSKIDSMSFLTGTGGVRVGAGDVNERPALDGVDWSSDNNELDADDPVLMHSLRLVEGMLDVMGKLLVVNNLLLLLTHLLQSSMPMLMVMERIRRMSLTMKTKKHSKTRGARCQT